METDTLSQSIHSSLRKIFDSQLVARQIVNSKSESEARANKFDRNLKEKK